jgi:hypothetical protein
MLIFFKSSQIYQILTPFKESRPIVTWDSSAYRNYSFKNSRKKTAGTCWAFAKFFHLLLKRNYAEIKITFEKKSLSREHPTQDWTGQYRRKYTNCSHPARRREKGGGTRQQTILQMCPKKTKTFFRWCSMNHYSVGFSDKCCTFKQTCCIQYV